MIKRVCGEKEADPLTNKNLWQNAIDQWVVKQNNPLYQPPTETCGASAATDIQIVSPEINPG